MSWVVALIFALSAFGKSRDYDFFYYIAKTQMFPLLYVSTIARVVIGLEVLTALALLWPRSRRWGWLAVASLCSAFTVFHVAAAVLGDLGPCRCLVVEVSHDAVTSHIIMGLLCIALTVWASLAHRGSKWITARSPIRHLPRGAFR